MSRRHFSLARALGVIAALVVLGAAPASAQDYPMRPIRILVPYAPGGIADIAARIVGAKLTEAWGQQVAVENRPGGNGFIAMELTARSAPDGYTLVMCTVGDVSINPGLFKEMPYDVERDFAPIASISDAPVVLRPTAPVLTRRSKVSSPLPRRSRVRSMSARPATAASTSSFSN